MRKSILATAAVTMLLASGAVAQAAESCMSLGGVAVANFFAEGDDQPIIISASLMGTVNNAAGKITAQRKTETGLEMDMEHYFGRNDGGAFSTKDKAILTAVPGKPGRFMIEIHYEIQEDATRGTLKGYKGSFDSYGLVDLRSGDDMKGLVRYGGEICK